MAYFKRTNLFKRILFSRGMALALMVVIVFMGFGLFSLIGKSIDASKARKLAEVQAASLQQKQDQLSKEISSLDTPDGQQAVLREEYPVVMPGEHVVVITDGATDDGTASAATPAVSAEQAGFWNFLKSLFRKNNS